MTPTIGGIIPVMLTPFDAADAVDFAGLGRLTDWYLANGAGALFAVCQSSEMQFLSLDEREAIARFVVERVAGRIPVLVSGHIATSLDDQAEELGRLGAVGADALVLVTNRLDPNRQGITAFEASLDFLLARLPDNLSLGLYECPVPYRRLLNDEEFKLCCDSGRFVALKDVSCDLVTVKRRIALAAGSPLKVINANAAIAYDAMRAGSPGFCGVAANIHPDLYRHLLTADPAAPLTRELAGFLELAGMFEAYGYPVIAKAYHQRIGTFASIASRALVEDVRERVWGFDALLDHLIAGTESFRERIAADSMRKSA